MDPNIAHKDPYALDRQPGTYGWCACGQSKKHSFCDGLHKGSGFEPTKIELARVNQETLYGCKHSAKNLIATGPVRSPDPVLSRNCDSSPAVRLITGR